MLSSMAHHTSRVPHPFFFERLPVVLLHEIYKHCDVTLTRLRVSRSFTTIRSLDAVWLTLMHTLSTMPIAAVTTAATSRHDDDDDDDDDAKDGNTHATAVEQQQEYQRFKNSHMSRPYVGYTLPPLPTNHDPTRSRHDPNNIDDNRYMDDTIANRPCVWIRNYPTYDDHHTIIPLLPPYTVIPSHHVRPIALASSWSSYSSPFSSSSPTATSSFAPMSGYERYRAMAASYHSASFMRLRSPAPPCTRPPEYKYDHMFKVLSLGDYGAGKSSFVIRAGDDTFTHKYIATIGVDFKIRTYEFHGKIIKLQHWDIASSSRFATVTSAYYRGAIGIFVHFDLSNYDTWTNVGQWMKEIDRYGKDGCVVVLLGCKADLPLDPKYGRMEKIHQFAHDHGVHFLQCSAKTGSGVDYAHHYMIAAIYASYQVRDPQYLSNAPVHSSRPDPRMQPCPSPSPEPQPQQQRRCILQ